MPNQNRLTRRLCRLSIHGLAAIVISGCAASTPQPQVHPIAAPVATAPEPRPNPATALPPPQKPAARINGRPVPPSRLYDLLIESRGAEVLDVLVGHEVVAAEAQRLGVALEDVSLDAEIALTLSRLVDPLGQTLTSMDDAERRELLDRVLTDRKMARGEFDLLVRRNALLRQLVREDITPDAHAMQREFERLYGEKYVARHIQLNKPGQADRVLRRLREGADFTALAREYSVNRISAADGGMLAPFSRHDDKVPGILREACTTLRPGEVSGILRAGNWYHIVQLVQVIEALPVTVADMRQEVEASLRRRLETAAMQQRFEKLLRAATIEVYDPALDRAWRRHPNNRRP